VSEPEVHLLIARLAELVVAPAALALAARHLVVQRGRSAAVVDLVVLSLYGFLVEQVGVAHFDRYTYGEAFMAVPLGVPVAVAVTWCAVLVAIEAMAAARGRGALATAALASGLGVLLDATMEGVAKAASLWSWTPPGECFGAPPGNYVGWVCIVFPWVALRRAGRSRLVAGAVGGIAVFTAGEAWTRLDLDRRLAAVAPFAIVAIAVVVAAAALAWPRRGRVAAAVAAYFVVLGGFAAFAAILGSARLGGVAAVVALAAGAVGFAEARSARRAEAVARTAVWEVPGGSGAPDV
jgi:hypothetical protein